MHFTEQQLCKRIQEQFTFSGLCRELADAHRESRKIRTPLILHEATQEVIYKQLARLLPGFSEKTLHSNIWAKGITVIDLSEWSMGLAHCGACVYQDKLLAVTLQLIKSIKEFNGRVIATVIYNLRQFGDSETVRHILNALCPHLNNKGYLLEGRGIANILYGLQKLSDEAPEVKAILTALLPHLNSKNLVFNAQEIGSALYGLQRMSDSAEVKAILTALLPHLKNKNIQLDAQGISNALYGLHHMADSVEVKAILNVLLPHLSNKNIILDAQGVSNVLYGLQRMSDSAEVKAILTALLPHLSNKNIQLPAQGIGNALYGLHHMEDSAEVKAILKALLPHLNNENIELSAQNIGNALYGLHRMSDSAEVKAILKALLPHLNNKNIALNGQGISNALYGLQKMSDSAEVKAILNALLPHLNNKNIALNGQGISNALYGLRNKATLPEAITILSALKKQLEHISFSVEAKGRWMAEVIYSLLSYLKSSNKRIAVSFIEEAASSLGTRAPQLEQIDDFNIMQQIIQKGSYLTQTSKAIELDLHCTYELAKGLCQYLLTEKYPNSLIPLIIIFGRSPHQFHNRGEMQALVESTLVEYQIPPEKLTWEKGCVIISV